ncbi:MAG: DNA topoisomerase [candidate division KSB1 bacterium]|nr:DNA topoisomerase [candidate division KSB1 bacterium]
MNNRLLVVESLQKRDTLGKFFKDATIILAEPVPRTGIGEFGFKQKIDETVRDWQPDTAGSVYLAFDPDTQGDALAALWKLALEERGIRVNRLPLQKITKKAVKHAFEQKYPVNYQLFKVQREKERFLQSLSDKMFAKNGDTETPELPVFLEAMIGLDFLRDSRYAVDFIPRNQKWIVQLQLHDCEKPLTARLESQTGEPLCFDNKETAKAYIYDLKNKTIRFEQVLKHESTVAPEPPFNTLALLKAAAALKYTPDQALEIIRQLYEGIDIGCGNPQGLITFYLTDSTRMNEKALLDVREFILNHYGVEYVPKSPRFKGEDGLTAVIPVNPRYTPRQIKKHLNPDQYVLYDLIWTRCVASQMGDSKRQFFDYVFSYTNTRDHRLVAHTHRELARGFYQLLNTPGSAHTNTLFEFYPEQNVQCLDFALVRQTPDSHSKSRLEVFLDILNHSRLVDADEVDRLWESLCQWELLTIQGDDIALTSRTEQLIDDIKNKYPGLFNTEFIRLTKKQWRKARLGKKTPENVAQDLDKLIQDFSSALVCPVCSGKIVRDAKGRARCEHYPSTCGYHETGGKHSIKICPACGGELVERHGKYGRFFACINFPDCTHTESFSIGVRCPNESCAGTIVERRTKWGQLFYGCDRYPACKFASWLKPVNMACMYCGHRYLVESEDSAGIKMSCPKCKSTVKESMEFQRV